MVDRLAILLEHFSVTARVFHAGALCGTTALGSDGDTGQLHLVRSGPLRVIQGSDDFTITQPSLLLYPTPLPRRFVTDARHGADMVCADLLFQGGASNPIRHALPAFVCLPLQDVHGAAPMLALLFDEAFTQRCGRHAMVNRLFEVLMIQILRQLMESGLVQGGMLAGMSHPRLRNALVAMHAAPAQPWSLDALADQAGMSRSVFAQHFRTTLGCTPGAYLQRWRIGLAQQQLRQGHNLKRIASDTGYGSEAALSRAFKAQTGESPRQWRDANDTRHDIGMMANAHIAGGSGMPDAAADPCPHPPGNPQR